MLIVYTSSWLLWVSFICFPLFIFCNNLSQLYFYACDVPCEWCKTDQNLFLEKLVTKHRISHSTMINIKRSFYTVMQKIYLGRAFWPVSHSVVQKVQQEMLKIFTLLFPPLLYRHTPFIHLTCAFSPLPCPMISNFSDLPFWSLTHPSLPFSIRFALHWTRVMADEGVTTRVTQRKRKQRTHGRWLTLVDLICCVCSVFCFFLTYIFLIWGTS